MRRFSWLSKNSSTEQETTTAQRDDKRNSITARKSDVDKELEHDEMQPHKMQRKTDEQSMVIYGREQGSSSNSQLSCDNLDRLSSYSAKYPNIGILQAKFGHLSARRFDVLTELEHAAFQPGKKRKEEVHHWLTLVPRKKDEILSVIKDDEGSSSNSNLHGHIERFIKEVDELFQQGRFPNGLVVPDQESTRLPLLLGKELIGINFKQNAKQILEWLQNHEHSIIGVYGMGGVGKTTLLLHIHDQLLKDPNLYGKVYWVTVSQNCTVQKLQEDIAKVIGVVSLGEDDERKRASILHNKLASMGPIILILDDMWERFLGEKVGIPLEGSSCKLIISTRRHDVCLKMGCKDYVIKAEILSDVEAWGLFVDKLGHYDKLEEEAKKLARSVAQECACLPLAIATMASSMTGVVDINEWKNVLNELECRRGQDEMNENVLPILQVSYDRLKEERDKNCFLSCILYGEDVKIKRDTLIEMWIDEGLFDEIESWEDQVTKGHSILNKLESWCLLESCRNEFSSRSVKMHDLVRDMAISITQKHPRFIAKAGEKLDKVPNEEQWSNDLVKVSLSHNEIKEIPSGMAPNTTNLTVLMLNSNKKLKEIPELFFQHMKTLKVLDLSCTAIERVPQSVSDLVNLRVLSLHKCGALRCVPESFFQHMKTLKVLYLSCTAIERVPQSVSDLVNLRVLSLHKCGALRCVPESFFQHMKTLKVLYLSCTAIERVPQSVSDLVNLRVLSLHKCGALRCVPESFFQHMKTLKVLYLSCTAIERVPQSVSDLVNLRVLSLRDCALRCVPESFFQHMKTLKVLNLSWTSIERVPESVSDLENLRELLYFKCERLRYVPSVAKLTKLRVLNLSKCYKLEAAPRGLERLKSLEVLGYCPWDISNMRDFSRIIQSSWSSLRYFQFWIRDPVLFTNIYDSVITMNILGRHRYIPGTSVVTITGWEYREEENSWMLPKTIKELKIEKSDMKGRSLGDVLPSLGLGFDEATKVGGKLDSFSHLELLQISKCGNMKVVFSFTELPPHLPNLQLILVYECEEVEEIFQSNERASQCVSPPQSNPNILSLPNLNRLELGDLPQLKAILSNLYIDLPNLQELLLVNLPKLKLPITKQLHLPNLKLLRVEDCKEVEEIFHSNDRDSQSNPIILELPKLETLILQDLPKMKAVQSNLYIDVPKLTSLELIKLPKLKLPITVQLHLPTLEELTVRDCEEVEEIFQIHNPDLGLRKLKKLNLENLPKLKWVFPFTEKLHQLPNLKELSVFDCEEVEEIFQIYNPNLGLPNFSLLVLKNLPKLKWVFPCTFTEQLRQLPNLEKLRGEDCEEVEEIFRIYNPKHFRIDRYRNGLVLKNLPKLKWVFPFTEHPLHLVRLKYIEVLNCSMLHSICRGLILIPDPCVKDFCVKNCPKLKGKVFKIIGGIIIVDSKSTVKCMLNNTQFWEKLQQNFPDQAHLLSTFMSQGMELSQGLDDENDDGCGDGNGAEIDVECNYNQGMELWQGLDDNNDDGGGDGVSAEGDVDDDKTTWGASCPSFHD